MTDKMPPSKTMAEKRAEFEAVLAGEPEKLKAYQDAMDAAAGDWLSETMTHLNFLAAHRGIYVGK
jgi:hypothetical protein